MQDDRKYNENVSLYSRKNNIGMGLKGIFWLLRENDVMV